MTAAIHIEGLHKHYGKLHAVKGIDLEVTQGEIFGFIGPNGAGKSTTMRIVMDLIRASAGTVRVLGEEPRVGGAALRARIGYLPGEPRFGGPLTVKALLDYYADIATAGKRADWRPLAERFDLDPSRKVGELSRGNKQKLGIVQAFAHRPELLVLDEPTSGLDPLLQQEFLALLREARANGQTVFLSSHVLSEIEHVADHVALLRGGLVDMVSTVDALRHALGTRVRLEFDTDPSSDMLTEFARLPGVRAAHLDGSRIELDLDGSPDAIIKTAARYTVTDLAAERPDLEAAVIGRYGANGMGTAGASTTSRSAHPNVAPHSTASEPTTSTATAAKNPAPRPTTSTEVGQ